MRKKEDLNKAEAESQGKELGEEINPTFTPVRKSESVMTSAVVSFKLMVYYGISIGIWGLALNRSVLLFVFRGVVVGFLISALSGVYAIAFQRTKEGIRNITFGVYEILVPLAIIIGISGIIAGVIMKIFF